jgi:hypothetical protein
VGLDTFAARAPDVKLTAEDVRAFEAADIDLCGGMYSDGTVSFRGKVYADVIELVSGVNIYEQLIPPEEVSVIAQAFDRSDPEDVERRTAGDHYSVTSTEVRQLAAFFDICRDRGLGLVGWW